jgi:hypothetical protein
MNFDREYDYFKGFADNNGLYARFSMYGEDIKFDEELPLRERTNRKMIYQVASKGIDITVPINGRTWGDFYIAANTAIMVSDDLDHCYVEDFRILEGGDVELITGS